MVRGHGAAPPCVRHPYAWASAGKSEGGCSRYAIPCQTRHKKHSLPAAAESGAISPHLAGLAGGPGAHHHHHRYPACSCLTHMHKSLSLLLWHLFRLPAAAGPCRSWRCRRSPKLNSPSIAAGRSRGQEVYLSSLSAPKHYPGWQRQHRY